MNSFFIALIEFNNKGKDKRVDTRFSLYPQRLYSILLSRTLEIPT